MKILEGSNAIAQIIRLCQPAVISAYPITPQTHIVEDLAKIKANGEANYEYVRAESEFAAASIVAGASATGARVYSATSSQGLLLMTEVLFNIAGMRLPVVLTCANRAVSSPINIWNDQQDVMTLRDAGWLLWFTENVQEAVDLHLLAYKVAEQTRLPVMVNVDGFILTHTFENVVLPSQKQVKDFLPKYKPEKGQFLDINNPKSLGCFATPEHYLEIREDLHNDILASKKVFKKEVSDFKKVFNRKLDFIEYFGHKNPETIIVSLGSVIGTVKSVVEELLEKNKKVGVLKITSLRPFPEKEIINLFKKLKPKNLAVLDKNISLGQEGVLATELKSLLYNKFKINLTNFIVGLGGKDITKKMIQKIFVKARLKSSKSSFFENGNK